MTKKRFRIIVITIAAILTLYVARFNIMPMSGIFICVGLLKIID